MAFGMFKRALVGAGIGGLYGGMSDNGSVLGGALGGAAALGPGVWGARALGRRYMPGGTLAGGIGAGLRRMAGGAFFAANRADTWTGGIGSRMATGLYRGAGLMGRGAGWMGGSGGAMVNKWGGRALMGMGVASGAMIGSSIISSNNGF